MQKVVALTQNDVIVATWDAKTHTQKAAQKTLATCAKLVHNPYTLQQLENTLDKGIRPFVNAKFVELNPQRKAGTLTNTAFRKAVMASAMEAFGITLASAATHYNHAFQAVKKATPAEVEGLGRPDDKKGGRKRKAVAAPTVASVIPQDPTAVLQGLLNAPAAAAAEQVETAQAVETPAGDPNDAGETGEVQTLFTVKKKSDDTVVAEGVTLEAAKELVQRAADAKKAKLYWV